MMHEYWTDNGYCVLTLYSWFVAKRCVGNDTCRRRECATSKLENVVKNPINYSYELLKKTTYFQAVTE